MRIQNGIQNELKELMRLVKLSEQFTAVVAHGFLLPLDEQSRLNQQSRMARIDELSRKYGLI